MVDPELLKEFVAEAQEHLEAAEREILACEQGQASQEHINRLFRALHTIKGGAGLVRAGAMTRLAHALESVVGRLRSKQLEISTEATEALLAGVDRLKALLLQVVAAGGAMDAAQELPIAQEVAALDRLLGTEAPAPALAPALAPAPPPPQPTTTGVVAREPLLKVFLSEAEQYLEDVDAALEALRRGGSLRERELLLRALHRIKGAAASLQLDSLHALCLALEDAASDLQAGAAGAPRLAALQRGAVSLRALLRSDEAEPPVVDAVEALRQVRTAGSPSPLSEYGGKLQTTLRPAAKGESPAVSAKQESVRISVTLLDKLMNLAAELVLVRNQNVQAADARDLEQLLTSSQRLNVLTSELQATVMRTRMRAIAGVFNKFQRTARDMGRALGKEVELEMRGGEVELDKGIIDALGDPLMHLVRNAIAHGIEKPELRQTRGKPRAGRVVLTAHHRHGQVQITVQDDGAGMDPMALLAEAQTKGMLTADQAAELSEREALELVFLPGFTTATDVTDIAGRGVGMDVVRQALGRVGGDVEITSRYGEGTCLTIKLPLTLAIVPALIVAVGPSCFAIPQQNIDEVVWLHGADLYQRLKLVDQQEVYSLRGTLLPVLRLGQLLGMQPVFVDPKDASLRPDPRAERPDRRLEDDADALSEAERRRGERERRVSPQNSAYIVALRVGEEHFGLLVDRVVDTEEIVVKGLYEQLKVCRAYAGTTVLGDGRIALILDVAVLAQLGGLRWTERRDQSVVMRSSGDDRQTVLLFDIGGDETFALPLRQVSRVEKVPWARIRLASGREHIDFRGGVIPLLRLESLLAATKAQYAAESCYVVIPKGEEPVGIVAARIRDTSRIAATIDVSSLVQPGVLGSALVEDRLTLFLDLFELLARARGGASAGRAGAVAVGGASAPGRRVLLAEDSAFFAALLVPHLRKAGLNVKLVQHGKAALEALEAESFDLLISDLEMPQMGGFELAAAVRRRPSLAAMRLLAISSLAEPSTEQRAIEAGFDAFISKLDQDRLLDRVVRWLS